MTDLPQHHPLQGAMDEAFGEYDLEPGLRNRYMVLALELVSVGYSSKAAVSFLKDVVVAWNLSKWDQHDADYE